MPNLTTVGLTSGAATSGTGTVSTLDNVIGVAGTPSAQVQTVQGVTSMTPLKVDPSAVTSPVSATQTGTWTVQPGNTANTTAWKVDGSAVTQPVSGTVTANIGTGITKNAGAADATTTRVTIDTGQLGSMVTGDFTKATPTVPVEFPSDQVVPIKVQAVANGQTSSRVVAAASTNATSLKASAGNAYQIDLFNVAAYDVFFKFYNKASAPTVGTDTPTWTIPIKAGTGYSNRFPFGKSFATGIAYAITKLQADSDTTVLVAGDVTGSIDWI